MAEVQRACDVDGTARRSQAPFDGYGFATSESLQPPHRTVGRRECPRRCLRDRAAVADDRQLAIGRDHRQARSASVVLSTADNGYVVLATSLMVCRPPK